MFEINQLRCFIAVVEELHFRRAAERLSMTQPPLSRQIRLLEHHVGVPLLERNSRVVRLTAAGKAFFPQAVNIVQLAEQASVLARGAAKGEHGSLSIGFTSASGYSLLPEIIQRLRARRPDINVVLKELVSTRQVEELNGKKLDIGLMRPHPLSGDLKSMVLLREPLMLAIPSSEASQWPDQPTLRCLHGKPFLMFSPHEAGPFYHMLNTRFKEAGVEPDIVQYVGQVHTMLALVRAGLGAAIIAESASNFHFDNITLRYVDTEPVDIIGVWRPDNDNPALKILLEDIVPKMDINTAD